MLASAGALPSGPGWIAEPKMDGWRAIVTVAGDAVTVRSRHGTDLTERFPELAALAGRELVLDGELVVYGPDGLPDFHALGRRSGQRSTACLVAFDLLSADGATLRGLQYRQRRERLERLELPPVVQPVVTGAVAEIWAATGQLGLEGIVAKRANSPYRSGRSRSWIKAKHWTTSTVAVCGYAPGPRGLSALFVACGTPPRPAKVELGLHRPGVAELAAVLPTLVIERRRDAVWVEPLIHVVVRHHGRAAQPRDAAFLRIAT